MARFWCSVLTGISMLALIPVAAATKPTAPAKSIALEDYLRPQTSVKLEDGRRFNLFCLGKGGPTAIVDSSLSQWSLEWKDIHAELARTTRVCTFDRAGYGFSDPGPLPRSSAAETADLEQALKAASILPPYVLVGHSLGGMNMRLFAYKHPEQVSGLLLIDPSIEHADQRLPYPKSYYDEGGKFYRSCLSQLEAGELIPGRIMPGDDDPCLPERPDDISENVWKKLAGLYFGKSRYEVMLSEQESMDASSSKEMDASRHSLGSVPLIILSSDKSHFTQDRPKGVDADALYNAWIAAHNEQARDSTLGKNTIVEGASHFIFEERPEIVIQAFKDLVGEAKKYETRGHKKQMHSPK